MHRVRGLWNSAWRLIERFGPRMRDLAFIGTSLLFTAGLATSGAGPLDAWAVAGVGIACSLALWWRRRFPVAVTAVALVGQLVIQLLPALGFALLTLAVRRRDWVLAVMAVAGYAAYVVPWAITNEGSLLALLITGPFVIGSFVAAGAYIGTRRDLMASLQERVQRAEAERELRAEQARLAERARIAQEMHDVLAHKVSLIALHAGGLEVNPAMGPAEVESSAGLIRETARQAMEDLRQVLGVLRQDVSVDGADMTPVTERRGPGPARRSLPGRGRRGPHRDRAARPTCLRRSAGPCTGSCRSR